MTWVVDIGNSSIKWAEYEAGAITAPHSYLRPGATVAKELDSIWGDLESPGEMICSCVAGDKYERSFKQWCKKTWGLVPVFVRATEQACGVSNAYIKANRLGADRWAALIAAKRLVSGPCCIIDCGTAITIDVLQEDGQHLGGLILPGLTLMRESLSGRTQMLIEESEGDNTTLFARNTADAINGGALYTVVATLDRIYSDVEQALGVKVGRIITGGDAEGLLHLLHSEPDFVPDLVLQGLAVIYQSQQEGDS